jgi:hypothetical protein
MIAADNPDDVYQLSASDEVAMKDSAVSHGDHRGALAEKWSRDIGRDKTAIGDLSGERRDALAEEPAARGGSEPIGGHDQITRGMSAVGEAGGGQVLVLIDRIKGFSDLDRASIALQNRSHEDRVQIRPMDMTCRGESQIRRTVLVEVSGQVFAGPVVDKRDIGRWR